MQNNFLQYQYQRIGDYTSGLIEVKLTVTFVGSSDIALQNIRALLRVVPLNLTNHLLISTSNRSGSRWLPPGQRGGSISQSLEWKSIGYGFGSSETEKWAVSKRKHIKLKV
jgi:hypothetical protein